MTYYSWLKDNTRISRRYKALYEKFSAAKDELAEREKMVTQARREVLMAKDQWELNSAKDMLTLAEGRYNRSDEFCNRLTVQIAAYGRGEVHPWYALPHEKWGEELAFMLCDLPPAKGYDIIRNLDRIETDSMEELFWLLEILQDTCGANFSIRTLEWEWRVCTIKLPPEDGADSVTVTRIALDTRHCTTRALLTFMDLAWDRLVVGALSGAVRL